MTQALILAAEHSENSKFGVGLVAVLLVVGTLVYFGLRKSR